MFPQPGGCCSVYAECVCIFVVLFCSSKFKERCYTPLKHCSGCVIQHELMKKVLVVSVFLEVTLKHYLCVVLPRGLSKLFLKISDGGDSDFPRQSTPLPDYSHRGASLDFRLVLLGFNPIVLMCHLLSGRLPKRRKVI